MKIRAFIILAVILLGTTFIACKDNSESVGGSILPPSNSIFVGKDSISLDARTITTANLANKSYFPTLGELDDPILGSIKTDFLFELNTSKEVAFDEKTVEVNPIDSVSLEFHFSPSNFVGDSLNLIGVSAYELDKVLDRDFSTDINPSDYCNLTKPLGKNTFTIKNLPLVHIGTADNGTKYYNRVIKIKLEKSVGERLYKKWKSDPSVFERPENFRNFFHGIYISTTFGSGSVIHITKSNLVVDYKYNGRKKDDSADSTMTKKMVLSNVSNEVRQLKHLKNDVSPSLIDVVPNKTKSYLTSPTGLSTELTIHLKDIITKIGTNRTISQASFRLTGFTEEETKFTLPKPNDLLFINKDSLQHFFNGNERIEDYVTSFVFQSVNANNSYTIYQNGRPNNNLARMMNHYISKYKNETVVPDIKYVLIPIYRQLENIGTQKAPVYISKKIYPMAIPQCAVLRTDPEHLKLEFIFNEF